MAKADDKSDFTQFLVRQGVISLDQVAEAKQMAKGSGVTLADALIRLGYASGDEVMKAVARQHGLDLVEPGLVRVPDWRPDGDEDSAEDHPVLRLAVAAVGRKP